MNCNYGERFSRSGVSARHAFSALANPNVPDLDLTALVVAVPAAEQRRALNARPGTLRRTEFRRSCRIGRHRHEMTLVILVDVNKRVAALDVTAVAPRERFGDLNDLVRNSHGRPLTFRNV